MNPRRLLPQLRTHRRLLGAGAVLLTVAVAAAACSGAGSGSGSDAEESASSGGSVALVDPTEAPGATSAEDADRATGQSGGGGRPTTHDVVESARSVIATGTVSLRADDVEGARFDVQRVVDENGGEIADEETGTDPDGEVRRSRLVLRVPVDTFDEVITTVSRVAELARATRSAEDVTTQVIDTEVRVRAQRASLQRIEALLARAEDLEDIVAIESQLTSRQAELDSLEQQQAYLADQTSMATVTVLVERAAEPLPDDVDRAGFLVGLGEGWEALQRSTVAVLTVTGALLPFALLLALLAVPARVLLRRRARRSARTASAAPAAPGPSTG